MHTLLDITAVVFWVSVTAVAYAYVGYPLVIWSLSRVFGRNPTPPAVADQELPSVSLLITAFNEEKEIAHRIANGLAQDYPAGKLEVVIATDGCTDSTCDIIRSRGDPALRLVEYPNRRGKPTVLNDTFSELSGDIVVLSDANSYFADPNVICNLVRWFRDPGVAAVCGRLVLTDPATGNNVDGLYWKYETFLKRCESRLGALLGSNGAIYAIRRELFEAIPADTVNDDLVIPLRAKIRTGKQIIYDPTARALEETPPGLRDEFARRSRIGAGGLQCLSLLSGLLHPRHGWTAFAFVSHKLLRWACPFLMLAALAANITLAVAGSPLYQLLLTGQLFFYALALLGDQLPTGPKVCKVVRLTTMFTMMNAALLVGFARWFRGAHRGTWNRTARGRERAHISVPIRRVKTPPLPAIADALRPLTQVSETPSGGVA